MKKRKCGHPLVEDSVVTFRNGTKHVQRKCRNCNKHLGYLPRDRDISHLPEVKTHREERIENWMPVGCLICGGVCGPCGFCSECRRSDDAMLIKKDAKQNGIRVWDLSNKDLKRIIGVEG